MNLDPSLYAPLLRGLFIEAFGLPVLVSAPGAASGAPASQSAGAPVVAGPAEGARTILRLGSEAPRSPEEAIAELSAVFSSARNISLPARLVLLRGSDRLEFDAAVCGAVPAPSAEPDPRSASARSRVVAGRVCLVTGGAQGFGAEIVRGLAASGAFLFIADLNHQGAASLARELASAYPDSGFHPIAVDVTKEASVAAMFAEVASISGGLDLLVSNAGVLKAGSVLEQDEASFRFVTDVNYTGFFFMAKHAARLMRLQRLAAPRWSTDIIQINSKSGLQGSNKNGAYAGSKFGSIGLVQSFALELVQYGIKVNAICPGNFFDGPLWSDPVKGLFVQYLQSGKVPGAKTLEDVRAYYESKVPMGRGTNGADVMRALYYLVEQEYETGQALPVTGGQVMLA